MSVSIQIAMRMLRTLVALVCLVGLSSCFSTTHVVGQGATQGIEAEGHSYWIFYGLTSLDSQRPELLAEDATSYEVTTYFSFTDLLLNLFTFPFTVIRGTVQVRR